MLKSIDPSDAELGMFVEGFEGNWFQHPFWKRRFVLTDMGQVETLRSSAVRAVIIDISKGTAPAEKTSGTDRPIKCVFHAETPARTASFGTRQPSSSPSAPARMHTSQKQFGHAKKVARDCTRVVSQIFLKARLGKAVNLRDVEPVIDEIYKSISGNPHVLNAVLRCQRHTGEVYRHSLAVSSLMVGLGRAMRLPSETTRIAGMVGLLMDIGLGQMDEIVKKAGGDFRKLSIPMQQYHVMYGFDIVARLENMPRACVEACLDHHERLDGSGYPAGKSGADIGQLARMAAICDEFDYLVSGRLDEGMLSPHEAIAAILARCHEFDAEILRAFQRSTGLYPIGTFVELRSGRLAMVVDLNPDEQDMPIVRTIPSWTARSSGKQTTINLAQCYGQDRIVGVATPYGLTGNELQALRARTLDAALRNSDG